MDVISAAQLTAKRCQPCEGGVEPCTLEAASSQLQALPNWKLSADGKMIVRQWKMKNFVDSMALLNAAAEIAEQDQHHPDLHLTGYRMVAIELTTHAIGGLSENDFILAAKIEAAAAGLAE